MRQLSWFGAALLLALVLAWIGARTPAPRPAEIPAAEFSAGRAMADVEAMARAPHPTGSVENLRVRAHVLARMRALGLETSEQRAAAHMSPAPGTVLGAWATNLIGVLPGRDRTLPPVLLMSHYDSAAGSPGAADDAAGVAASLEAVRALQAAGQPARDVVVLVTDAEEQGLLGAQAFFREHPLARRVGVVINLEARGAAGRAYMFETGPGNGAAIDLYRRAVGAPASTSLAVFMYRVMPNDTDFTHARAAGLPGYNLAFIGRLFHYHAMSSTPERLHRGSLQHMGEQTLDLLRGLSGEAPPPPARPDAVYSDLFGLFVVAYPAWGGWIALGLAGLLTAALALVGRRRGGLGWTGLAAGAGLGLALLLLAAAAARLARRATGVDFGFVEARPLMARTEAFEAALALLGLGLALGLAALAARRGAVRWLAPALGLGLGLALQLAGFPDYLGLGLGLGAALFAAAALWRPPAAAEAGAGMLALLWLLGLAAQLLAPEAALALHWPLLAAALAAFLAARLPGRGGAVAATLAAGIGAGFVLLLGHVLYVGVGLDTPEILAACLLLAAACLQPLLARATARPGAGAVGLAALLALVLSAGLIGWIRSGPPAHPDRPALSHVQYLAEPGAGRYRLVAALPGPDPWSRAVLARGGTPEAGPAPELWARQVWSAPAARVVAEPAPLGIERLSDGRVVLRLLPSRAGPRELRLNLEGEGALADLALNGEALAPPPAGEPFRLRWADPSGGLTLVFRPPVDAPLQVTWVGVHDGWPRDATPLPPRPGNVMPWGSSDTLAVVGRRELAPVAPRPDRSPAP